MKYDVIVETKNLECVSNINKSVFGPTVTPLTYYILMLSCVNSNLNSTYYDIVYLSASEKKTPFLFEKR